MVLRSSRCKTDAIEKLPAVVEVMDPFNVVKLAGDSLDEVRRRVQQETTRHRVKKGDPLRQARRALNTGYQLLTERQQQRIVTRFANENHADFEATWSVLCSRTSSRFTATRTGPWGRSRSSRSSSRSHRGFLLVLLSRAGWV